MSAKKAKGIGAVPMSFAFIEGCMFCVGNFQCKAAECFAYSTSDGDVLVIFLCNSLNNVFGNRFAVLNEEDAKHTENKHNGAINKE